VLAQPDPAFEAFRKKLVAQVRSRSDEVITGNPATEPEDFGIETTAGIHAVMSRDGIATTYVEAFDSNQLVMSDAIALTAQHETMAAAEKAMTMRRKTRLGFLIEGVSKAYGQVQATGVLEHVLKQLAVAESQ